MTLGKSPETIVCSSAQHRIWNQHAVRSPIKLCTFPGAVARPEGPAFRGLKWQQEPCEKRSRPRPLACRDSKTRVTVPKLVHFASMFQRESILLLFIAIIIRDFPSFSSLSCICLFPLPSCFSIPPRSSYSCPLYYSLFFFNPFLFLHLSFVFFFLPLYPFHTLSIQLHLSLHRLLPVTPIQYLDNSGSIPSSKAVSRNTQGTIQPPNQWLPGPHFLEAEWFRHEFTTHLQLISKLRMRGVWYPPVGYHGMML